MVSFHRNDPASNKCYTEEFWVQKLDFLYFRLNKYPTWIENCKDGDCKCLITITETGTSLITQGNVLKRYQSKYSKPGDVFLRVKGMKIKKKFDNSDEARDFWEWLIR